jgi:hypothetical protein
VETRILVIQIKNCVIKYLNGSLVASSPVANKQRSLKCTLIRHKVKTIKVSFNDWQGEIEKNMSVCMEQKGGSKSHLYRGEICMP